MPESDSLEFQPGDCLLYRPVGFFGRLIAIKTWHPLSHVEVYVGNGISVASRDGQGVGHYPLRLGQLAYVLRPTTPLDLAAGLRYARRMTGTPYGWMDLLNFVGVNVDAKGIVCSPFATEFYRACGWRCFPADDPNDIAPFQFTSLIGCGFSLIWCDTWSTRA